jgi:hypothetical protein
MTTFSWTLQTQTSSAVGTSRQATKQDKDLGVDILCVDDLDPHFRLVSGVKNVACAQARRLSIARGGLFYAPGYGDDLSSAANSEVTRGNMRDLQRRAETESKRDERVRTSSVSITWVPEQERIKVSLCGETKAGKFALVQDIGDITVTTIKTEQ